MGLNHKPLNHWRQEREKKKMPSFENSAYSHFFHNSDAKQLATKRPGAKIHEEHTCRPHQISFMWLERPAKHSFRGPKRRLLQPKREWGLELDLGRC